MAKTSINMPDHLIAAMDGRKSFGGDDRSTVIWRSLARYLALINRSKADMHKRFDRQECGLILDACNDVAFIDTVSIQLLPESVEDAIEMDQLDQKWGVSGAGIMGKLKALTYTERMAMVDSIQLWWDRVGSGEQPDYDQLLIIPAHDRKTDLVV